MFSLMMKDKRAAALIFVAAIAVVSIVLGLYLILVQDVRTKASWSANIGALYFAQSSKQGFAGDAADEFLDKAYDAHMKAVEISPYDAGLWVRAAYVVAVKEQNADQAFLALDIAQALAPETALKIAQHRKKIVQELERRQGR